MHQCPRCKNYGVYLVKRRWWQRLLKMPHRYYCYDCRHGYHRSQIIDIRKKRDSGQL